ncbi:hypothetical protein ACN3VN_11710 [Xylella fastidiosa]|uniref:hypothetical protein n=1 Tax=Xylella fastidiosa TaxID=2371 RepID=UPI000AF32ECF|nr:hypothetical protein [Xylella fastidiosa]
MAWCSPHHRITASPHHRITASPHHRITASLHTLPHPVQKAFLGGVASSSPACLLPVRGN